MTSTASILFLLKLGSPAFADDMTILTIFPTFLQLLMDKAFLSSHKWRFDYNETKDGAVTFGEHGPDHFREKNNTFCTLGHEVVEELNKYKNLGIVKIMLAHFNQI